MKVLLYIYTISWLILLCVYLYSCFCEKKKNKGSDSLAVDAAMLIFAPIVVVALPFIFFSDSKKRKSKKMTSNEQKVFDKMNELLYGGTEQFEKQTWELYKMLRKKYKPEQIANALTWMSLQFTKEGDKSEYGLVDDGQMRRPKNTFSREDAVTIYRYVAKKSFRKALPDAPEDMFELWFANLGNSDEGCTTDVIPGAYGEYGYDLTNPIPTRGVPSNETYLRRLRLLSGENFKWERIGSFGAPNIKHCIDGYEIKTENGESLCIIYISPYQHVISNQAPKGFYLV